MTFDDFRNEAELKRAREELYIYRAMRKVLFDAGEWAFDAEDTSFANYVQGVMDFVSVLLPDSDKRDTTPNNEAVASDGVDETKNVNMFDGDITYTTR